MIAPHSRKRAVPYTVMGRLRNDKRGSTLAMLAIALVPLSLMVGSGIDTARLYVVKARLQQACDAGVLAGRKAMVSSTSTTLDSAAATQATTFFSNNFKSGWMSTNTVSFTPAKTTDQQVSGTASATVPMTITGFFASPVALTVTCEARYDVADTDIMFVLDTTGSMACTTADDPCGAAAVSYTKPDGTTAYHATEESGSKISGLRSAVLNFYDTIAANVDPSTHVRYGFVTYTSTVNAGYALPQSAIVDNWNYESRSIVGDANNGSSSASTPSLTQTQCAAANNVRTPASGFNTDGTATFVTTNWSSSKCNMTTQPIKPTWRYQQVTYDTSQYKTGATVDDPSKITNATSKWQGCVEERDTTATSTFDVNNLPPDLDPDLSATSDSTKWRPMWPDVMYYRGNNTSVDYSGNISLSSTPPSPYAFGDYAYTGTSALQTYTSMSYSATLKSGYVSCGKPVQRLAVLSRSDVSNYVNASDFVPQGGTYHDTGMIWGTRMIAPNGIFASDTAAWPGRNTPNRYIIFMTDGDMAPNYNIYGMYGLEYYDKRVTGSSGLGNDEDYHNARFLAECAAAKARNIKVFVIGFGQTLTSQLTACASPGKAYYASDNTSLNTAFQDIAKQVALLRISQ
ncbi:TadE/TadG family type IV pilus assembly protein [Sphingomonas bacterium]|uniref:TadE/TadG family type IV pilus assembly protein n=1 Tax=Sphingomonas bacterium TaxID=1895847 RepID=UPI00261E38D6|nr:TadE/TadG family type IV pilus assembly protein [Sphingomonas bacterium]MDB5678116.1 hypothetical protein [Sphingomonas bacterium]